MAFIRFTDTSARVGDPQVSIWSRGQIGFNQGAMQEFNIRDFQYVVLYFEPESQRIGFELTNDKDEKGVIKFVFRDNSGASISAIPFLRANRINYKEGTKKYDVEMDTEGKLLIVDLKNPKQ